LLISVTCDNPTPAKAYGRYDSLSQHGVDGQPPGYSDAGQYRRLSVAQAERLLAMLKERERQFELTLSPLPPGDQQYFRRRYAALKRFLNQAIELKTPIEASL
jgi:hypothetical protein